MNSNETKTVADFLIADFESEMQTTLRVIEAVPNGHLDYRPDATSKTGLGLLRHIGNLRPFRGHALVAAAERAVVVSPARTRYAVVAVSGQSATR